MKSMNLAVTVPKPCHEKWADMSVTAQGRFCSSCTKEVVDFTESTPAEIQNHLENATGEVCGRYRKSQVVEPQYAFRRWTPGRKFAFAALLVFGLFLFNVPDASARDMLREAQTTVLVENNNDLLPTGDYAIAGTVTAEQGEEENLINANVWLVIDSTVIRGTTTDQTGQFLIEIPPKYASRANEVRLMVSYVGYETAERTDLAFSANQTLNVEIKMNLLSCSASGGEFTVSAGGDGLVGPVRPQETIIMGISVSRVESIERIELSSFNTDRGTYIDNSNEW